MVTRKYKMDKDGELRSTIYELVPEATPSAMQGDTYQIKALNAKLTSDFIVSTDVPNDECLGEAKMIALLVNNFRDAIKLYLSDRFGFDSRNWELDPKAADELIEFAIKADKELK